MVAQR